MTDHYRLSEHWTEGGDVEVVVERFRVLRETNAGYWVLAQWNEGYGRDEELKRWTPKLGARYCHPNLEDAKRHYSIRKQHEQKHLKARLMKSQTALANIENLDVFELEREGYQIFSTNRPFNL